MFEHYRSVFSTQYTILGLDLSSCIYLEDVSALGNVRFLNLKNCSSLVDVSALLNVYSLNISYCNNIVDVSALQNTIILNIRWCKQIRDISMLRNVPTLYREGCGCLILWYGLFFIIFCSSLVNLWKNNDDSITGFQYSVTDEDGYFSSSNVRYRQAGTISVYFNEWFSTLFFVMGNDNWDENEVASFVEFIYSYLGKKILGKYWERFIIATNYMVFLGIRVQSLSNWNLRIRIYIIRWKSYGIEKQQ